MAKTRVALEITETSVRAVELSTGRIPSLLAAAEVDLPEGAAKDSEILDREAVALALQKLWADARISSRDVVLGVGNRRILVREHSTRLTNPLQIRQALPFEVQDRLPVPVSQAVLDFVPVRHDDSGVHGLLVAAVAEHMEDLVDALDHARLRAESIDLVAFGCARALAQLGGPAKTALFLSIGEHTTHIVIATGGTPLFVRVVPLDIVTPSEDSTAAPSPAAGNEPLPAGSSRAGMRRERGGSGEAAQLHPTVQAALIDLVGRVRSTVAFYRDRADAVPIGATWVAGAHAAHPRLLEALARVMETPVLPLVATSLVAAAPGLVLSPETDARVASTVALLIGGGA